MSRDFLQFLLDLEQLGVPLTQTPGIPEVPHAPEGEMPQASQGPQNPQGPQEPISPKPQKRCGACKTKLLLSDMACRCGVRHCSAHRLPETHLCTYDHGRQDRKVLETQVVACVADKMENRI